MVTRIDSDMGALGRPAGKESIADNTLIVFSATTLVVDPKTRSGNASIKRWMENCVVINAGMYEGALRQASFACAWHGTAGRVTDEAPGRSGIAAAFAELGTADLPDGYQATAIRWLSFSKAVSLPREITSTGIA